MIRIALAAALAVALAQPAQADWPFSETQDVSKNDKAAFDKYQAQRKTMRENAPAYIPTIQAMQTSKLQDFTAKWEKQKGSFNFHCDRWGDFLALYASEPADDGAVIRTILAVNIKTDTPITFVPGHAPDLGASQWIYGVVDDENNVVLKFDGSILSGQNAHGHSSQSMGQVLKVEGIAQGAENDRIVFGKGGGYAGDIVYSFSSGQNTTQLPTALPGATLQVPAGLGEGVYGQILECLKKGAEK